MKVEIDFESVHKLKVGDCIEISGTVGSNKVEITFLIGLQPAFRCRLDHKYGWDIFIFNKSISDINSGTLFTSLEFYPNYPFTISFQILTDAITTVLNDRELCSERQCTSVSDMTSIEISGDCTLKHVLFSDYASKSSRVLQPLIFLESNGNCKDQSITVIESRQRIIFKLGNNDSADYDSDSDLDIEESSDLHTEFDYLKTVLLSTKSTDNGDFSPHYPNDCPINRYIISYFDPDLIDQENEENIKNVPSKFTFYEVVNENMLESSSKISVLKSNTERIEESLSKTGKAIEEIRRPSIVESDNVTRTRKMKMVSIPISQTSGSYYKYDLTRGLKTASKIPVLKSPGFEEQKKPMATGDKRGVTKNQKNSPKLPPEKKATSLHRRRNQHSARK